MKNQKVLLSILMLSLTSMYARAEQKTRTPKRESSAKKNKRSRGMKETQASVAQPATTAQVKTPTVEASKSAPAQTTAARNVTIKNVIDKNMLGYKYGFMTYRPSTFVVKVNDQVVEQSKSCAIPVGQDNKICVRFDWAFLNGRRKGATAVDFELPADTNEFTMKFTWHTDSHFIIDKAKVVGTKKIY